MPVQEAVAAPVVQSSTVDSHLSVTSAAEEQMPVPASTVSEMSIQEAPANQLIAQETHSNPNAEMAPSLSAAATENNPSTGNTEYQVVESAAPMSSSALSMQATPAELVADAKAATETMVHVTEAITDMAPINRAEVALPASSMDAPTADTPATTEAATMLTSTTPAIPSAVLMPAHQATEEDMTDSNSPLPHVRSVSMDMADPSASDALTSVLSPLPTQHSPTADSIASVLVDPSPQAVTEQAMMPEKRVSVPPFGVPTTIVEDVTEGESSTDIALTIDGMNTSVEQSMIQPSVHPVMEAGMSVAASTQPETPVHEPELAAVEKKKSRKGILSIFRKSKTDSTVSTPPQPVTASATGITSVQMVPPPDLGMRAADMRTTTEQRIRVMNLVKLNAISVDEALKQILHEERMLAQVWWRLIDVVGFELKCCNRKRRSRNLFLSSLLQSRLMPYSRPRALMLS